MVTRKPVGPPLSTSTASSSNANPPYPTTPVDSAKSTASSNSVYSADLAKSPAFDLVDVQKAQQQRPRSDSDASSHGTWNSDDTLEEDHKTPDEMDIPRPLQIRPSQQDIKGAAKKEQNQRTLPESLRVGSQQSPQPTMPLEGQMYQEEAQSNPWAEQKHKPASTNAPFDSNNPYLQRQPSGVNGVNSQAEWQEGKQPPIPSAAPPLPPSTAPPPPPPNPSAASPVELSAVQSPLGTSSASEWLSQMSLEDGRRASWETAEVLPVPQKGQAPLPPVTSESRPVSPPRPLSTWWHDSETPPSPPVSRDQEPQVPARKPTETIPAPVYDPPPGPPPGPSSRQAGNFMEHEQSTQAQRPPPIDASQPSGSYSAVPETPGTQLKRQRSEHYQIKHINWYDTSYTQDRSRMRQSPVLTQNANGPCPLLALVNALVLSTPPDANTPLIETLRTREQVSLGLLLDAVFDELMSGRRGDTATQLPDVSELYSFLLALHTGMNVNPRFVTPAATPRGSLDGHPAAVTGVHPIFRAQRKAGAFEETKEMRLYSTFSIPLIHGWTAPANTPAYEAFARSAQTFEDAQNIQFLEAELEDKLRTEGLPSEEQQMLQDIQTIKAFLDTWPTQLTDFGLKTIAESLDSGQFAILFRNDHFSTVYKEPKHGALMTLVTDAGYGTHDEIVWESLVDVTGAACEMFSGDFRVVSHNQDARLNQGNSAGGEAGWSTVQSRNRRHGQRNSRSSGGAAPPPLPGPRPNAKAATPVSQDDGALDVQDSELQRKASEQEDHDLALALQLQEEEEDQQRQAEERRRREQRLSEQFLSNESEGPRPAVPPRRGGGRGGRGGSGLTPAAARPAAPTTRPAVSRPAENSNDPEAPPSYEQAASDPPYRPAGSTASANMAQGNPLGAYDALRRAQNSSTGNISQSTIGESSPPYQGRRISRRTSSMAGQAVPGSYNNPQRVSQAPGVKEAEDKCVVM
ncbi:hypothetical protein LTR37_006188 [Vermiconidia calcicola]|uniref:Uncharacterized protein n=1 Tax=Vermiconidia calcicola TaxID=1690605 RepID=A0ACC3NI63_9PEZI|nr:hypothetical protein LTR37_006188 [Vermiconidia calcicola]